MSQDSDVATPTTDRENETSPAETSAGLDAAELRSRIAQFAPAAITADLSGLSPSERDTLQHLIAASRYLDEIFDRQVWAGNPSYLRAMEADASELGRLRRDYAEIMRGPWDRQHHHQSFVGGVAHPPGAGFYPVDLTVDEFQQFVAAHPERKALLEGLYTVVTRGGASGGNGGSRGRGELRAIPYSQAYAEWLVPAANELRQAAEATDNPSLRRFLLSRARAFLDDDYYQSDKDWMDLDSRVGVTIGPYETYEDKLLGQKAAFESFVTVSDPAASKALAGYKRLLPAMEANLPLPAKYRTKRGAASPIRVVDLVYSSGDARKSVQTIAFNLPNDERVRAEKGAKKVLLRNLIETKFERILRPIGTQILAAEHLPHLSAEAFFNAVLFHELSHSLGPAYVMKAGSGQGEPRRVEVRMALGANYSPLEEAKADVMGVYNVLFMIAKGKLPAEMREKVLVSYFAGLFRSVRFGVAEAHGRGAAVQLNRYLSRNVAAVVDGRFKIDLRALEREVESLVADICLLQAEGDAAGVEQLLVKFGVMTPTISKALSGLSSIAVDIRPIYPIAGESPSLAP